MKKVKIILYPPFVQELLDKKLVTTEQMMDCNKFLSILSEYSVNKILYLNDGGGPDDSNCSSLFNLDIFKSYASHNSFGAGVKTSLPHYTVGSTLKALCRVGDEEITETLEGQLHNYALRFNTIRLNSKTYGVIFQPLCEVDTPTDRANLYLKDMRGLLAEISLELNDKELLEEDLYQYYLSLM